MFALALNGYDSEFLTVRFVSPRHVNEPDNAAENG